MDTSSSSKHKRNSSEEPEDDDMVKPFRLNYNGAWRIISVQRYFGRSMLCYAMLQLRIIIM
jgi:hypothetical protein